MKLKGGNKNMRKTNRFVALLMALVLVFSSAMSTAVFANEDVVGTSFEATVGKLKAVGIMQGYPDGTFKPEGEITRAEFAKIAVTALGLADAAEVSRGNTRFPDVYLNHWATGYINLAVNRGIIIGYPDGTFQPEGKLTNAEALTILVRLVGLGPVVDKQGTWPANYVGEASNQGILDGVNVASSTHALRGLTAEMLLNTLDVQKWGATGYDNDGSVSYGKLWKVNNVDPLTLLNDNLGITELEDVMFYGIDDGEVELGTVDYDYVGADLDAEYLFLNTVDAWINSDDEVIYVVKTSTQFFDAIEFDFGDDELTLVEADKDYGFLLDKDDEPDVVVYINGEEEDFVDLDIEYDYAKVVLDDKNKVIAISAYDWEDFLIVEDVDGTEVLAYGDDMDLEDYTVVKAGKTITLADLKEGDVLFYNSTEDYEYAEVYNNIASEGLVTDVFEDSFDVDGDEYDYENDSFDKGLVQYLNEDGDIDDFDSDAAEQMEDAEEDVAVFVDRMGNAVYVTGELGVAATSTLAAILYEAAVGYTDTRGREYIELDVVNENGIKATYDVKIEDLEEIAVNFIEYEIDDIYATSTSDNKFDLITVKEDNTAGTVHTSLVNLDTMAAQGHVVELAFDEGGNLVSLGFFDGDAKETFERSEGVSAGDTYISGRRVGTSVPVFIVDADDDGFWDDEDVEVKLYGDLETDTDLYEGTVYFDGRNAEYIVVTDSELDGDSSEFGVVTEVNYEAGTTKVARFTAFVDGSEKTFRMDDNKTEPAIVKGAALEIVVYDANGRVKEVDTTLVTTWYDLGAVSASRDREVMLTGLNTFELISGGYIYDVTDVNDIETMTWTELRDLQNNAGVVVKVIRDDASSLYVNVIVVDRSGDVVASVDAALTAAKNAAAALTDTDYTAASWTTLTTALAMAESTTAQKTAKTTAINDAIDDLVAMIASTIVFADGATPAAIAVAATYTNVVSGDGAGSITYTSSDGTVATVDAAGEVTGVAIGTTVITATKAATATHTAVTATYTLTVE